MKEERILYLGDIHGNFNTISNRVERYDLENCHIIQVGDFGVGFSPFEEDYAKLEIVNKILHERNIILYAIRGNHDYKTYFDNDPFEFSNIKLIPDYTILEIGQSNILCIGGAVSVDRYWEYTPDQRNGNLEVKFGQTWWSDEGFTLDVEKISEIRGVNIVVTHTSPHYCAIDNTNGLGPFIDNIIKDTGDISLREDLLSERYQMTELFFRLRENNDIEYHYYGHFHMSDTITIDGTIHRVLDSDELYEEKY